MGQGAFFSTPGVRNNGWPGWAVIGNCGSYSAGLYDMNATLPLAGIGTADIDLPHAKILIMK